MLVECRLNTVKMFGGDENNLSELVLGHRFIDELTICLRF